MHGIPRFTFFVVVTGEDTSFAAAKQFCDVLWAVLDDEVPDEIKRNISFEVEATDRGVVKVLGYVPLWVQVHPTYTRLTEFLIVNGYAILTELPRSPLAPVTPIAVTPPAPRPTPSPVPPPTPPLVATAVAEVPLPPAPQPAAEVIENVPASTHLPSGAASPNSSPTLQVEKEVLTLLALKPCEPHALTAQLEYSTDVILSAVDTLADAGLVVVHNKKILELTTEGYASAEQLGGRSRIVHELVTAGEPQTVRLLAETIQLSEILVKKVIASLRREGIVRAQGKLATGDRGPKPVLYGLTEVGERLGDAYQPPRSTCGWGKAGAVRVAVLREMLRNTDQAYVATRLARELGLAVRGVTATMLEGLKASYLTRDIVVEVPLTYAYTLTAAGHQEAERYVAAFAEVTPPPQQMYKLTITEPSEAVTELLQVIADTPGVRLTRWPLK